MHSNHATSIDGALLGISQVPIPLPSEDQARADFYALLACLLFAPPHAHLLASLASADSISSQQADHPLDIAWEKLIATAGIMDALTVREEFNALFISAGTPQINPYASLYLAGFLNEKPLAALRAELSQLGLARAAGVGEMEDHLAALCDTMRLLIAGSPGSSRQALACQKRFFEKHIESWVSRCLDDIRLADGANFYRQVADFMQAFLLVEAQAFEMAAGGPDGEPPVNEAERMS